MNLYTLGKAVTYLLVRIIFRIKHEGLENIPEGGGYILACNHQSYCDPPIAAHKVPMQVRYMAKEQLLKVPVLGFFIRRLGIIPVKRGDGDGSVIDTAIEVLRDGGILGIFPEGTRNRLEDGKMGRVRLGMVQIAGQTGADILPMAITYHKDVRFRKPVTVRYGELIPNGQLGIDLASRASLRQASKFVKYKIEALIDLPPPAQVKDK